MKKVDGESRFHVKYGTTLALILAGLPILSFAQTQPKPAQSSAAQQAQPAPSPNSKRFVTNENFYRPAAKPQPGSPTPVHAQPVTPAYTPANATANAPGRIPSAPAGLLPAPAAPTPGVVRLPQPVPPQPAALNAAAAAGHSSSVAVDYAYGKLTVVADNASLGAVLKLIAAKTGATVDLAPELQNEPVVARLGPDSVHEVLSRLFDSPRIDYIVFGTGDEPGSLQRILVRRRNTFGQMAGLRPQPAPVQPPQQQLDPDGNPSPQTNAADAQMSEQQRIEAWQKTREEMLQAEIKQQAEDREREKTQPQEQPVPQEPPQQQQDNPPQL
jgi:hypothetical protein